MTILFSFVWSLGNYFFVQTFNIQAVLVSNTCNQLHAKVCAPQLQSPVKMKRIKDEVIFNRHSLAATTPKQPQSMIDPPYLFTGSILYSGSGRSFHIPLAQLVTLIEVLSRASQTSACHSLSKVPLL